MHYTTLIYEYINSTIHYHLHKSCKNSINFNELNVKIQNVLKGCNVCCIGQTKRALKIRLKFAEVSQDINANSHLFYGKSVIILDLLFQILCWIDA